MRVLPWEVAVDVEHEREHELAVAYAQTVAAVGA